jgi:hypothetical protein
MHEVKFVQCVSHVGVGGAAWLSRPSKHCQMTTSGRRLHQVTDDGADDSSDGEDDGAPEAAVPTDGSSLAYPAYRSLYPRLNSTEEDVLGFISGLDGTVVLYGQPQVRCLAATADPRALPRETSGGFVITMAGRRMLGWGCLVAS